MHKEQEEAKVESTHKNKYLATELQGRRMIIRELTHEDRLGNDFDEGNHIYTRNFMDISAIDWKKKL